MTVQGNNGKQQGYILVENQQQLRERAADLQKESAIGVDLEADSMYHYREKVCLLQIATPFETFLIDPLAVKDLTPLAPVFADSEILKVFHGADYDIRSLYRDFEIEVNALFDTQFAARFLGLRETGLASLLKERIGVLVEKKYQKKDWSKRPLPEAMLTYAAQDACQLLDLARMLKKELREKGRLSWVKEESEILSRVRPKPENCEPLFMKFKGASSLDPRSLAVLEAILGLRDDMAKSRDLPPFKILGNTQIKGLIEKKPMSESDLKKAKALSPKQISAFGRSLVKRTNEAMDIPEDALPRYPRRARKTNPPRVFGRIKVLKEWRERRAVGLEVESSIVCSNAQIQSIASAYHRTTRELGEISELRSWQRDTFGHEICDLLESVG